MVPRRTSKQVSIPRGQRLQLNGPARRVNHLRTFQSIRVGGLSLVLIKIPEFMDRCHGYEQVIGIAWRKHDEWVGWRGPGMTNTKKNVKVFTHNHQLTIKTNLSMSNYLDQLREQVRLKQLGVKEPKKQQQSGLVGLPSLYDYIKPNTKDSTK